MSKRKRKTRRIEKVCQMRHDNRHHLCFQRRNWEKNAAASLVRNSFIYTIPVDIHNEYHYCIGKNIPIPEDIELVAIRVRDESPEFSKVWMACWYLISISNDKEFKDVMIE